MNRLNNRVDALENHHGMRASKLGVLLPAEGQTTEKAKQAYLAKHGGTEQDYRWIVVEFVKPCRNADHGQS